MHWGLMEKLEKLIKRCSVCKAIELNGKLIPLGSPGNIGNEGYKYSDAIFSYECARNSDKKYGERAEECMRKSEELYFETCTPGTKSS